MTKKRSIHLPLVTAAVFAALASATAFALARRTGSLPTFFGTEAFFTTPRDYLDLPLEFFLAIVAALALWCSSLAAAGSQAGRRLLFCAAVVLAGTAAGVYSIEPRNMLMLLTLCGALSLIWLTGRSDRWHAAKGGEAMRKRDLVLVSITIVSVGVALGALGYVAVAKITVPDALDQNLVRWYRSKLPADTQDEVGTAGRFRLVVFSDYQCPACSGMIPQYHALVRSYAERFPGGALLEIRDFPLESECNPVATTSRHPAACEAAAAVRLVHKTKGGDASADLAAWSYHLNADLTVEQLRAELLRLGLLEAFDENYVALVNEVRRDATVGRDLGVYSTPTLFLNGVKLPNLNPRALEALLQAELARAKPQKNDSASAGM